MRQLCHVVVCAVAVSLASCSSGNTGKIVGKWKMDTTPWASPDELKMMQSMQGYTFIEFDADGTFRIGGESSAPEVNKLIQMHPDKGVRVKGKYKLLGGRGVEMYALEGEGAKGMMNGKDRGRIEITINGDELSLKDASTTTKATRVK